MKLFKLLITAIMIASIISCVVESINDHETKKATIKKISSFELIVIKESTYGQMNSMMPSASVVTMTRTDNSGDVVKYLDDSDYAFGAIRGSKRFYFILKNSGDYDITNIQISSTNPAFNVFPKTISRLEPFSTAISVPIITVEAIHGTVLEGVGAVDLLPMGINVTSLNIDGTTKDFNGEAIGTQFTSTMSVYSLVANVDIKVDGVQFDLSTVAYILQHPSTGINVYNYNWTTQNISFVNTGNVTIEFQVLPFYPDQGQPYEKKMFNEGDTINISEYIYYIGENYYACAIIFNTLNVVYDGNKFYFAMNGKIGFNPVLCIQE
ncbi:MAG: hypothetical protein BWX59_01285 [Bacteroidetes bacterium ADurb.Bin028]|nr:MAG: hypothetical protein BWX59_01285 [Bacteroidetes bacterium ADurb.Bin028]